MNENKLCNQCIFTLLQLMSKEEILLLITMKKNNIINPQLSLNEKDLLELANKSFDKKVSIYSLRKMIYRLLATNFITGQKFTTMKFYLTINGIKAIQIYNSFISKQLKANKEVILDIVDDSSSDNNLIEDKEEVKKVSNNKKKKSNRMKGE